jgi:hypothetical protein
MAGKGKEDFSAGLSTTRKRGDQAEFSQYSLQDLLNSLFHIS